MADEDLYKRDPYKYWIELSAEYGKPLYVIHAPYFGGMIRFYKRKSAAEKFVRECNEAKAAIVKLQADWLQEFLGQHVQ